MRMEIATLRGEAAPSVEIDCPESAGSICGRIAGWAARGPRRAAVVDGDRRLSYEQLEERSNQLAQYLQKRGLGHEQCVALLFERSADFIIAALAVLKAGGAYLPLDSSIPRERASMILGDSGARLIVSHRGKTGGMAMRDCQSIEIDGADRAAIDSQPAEPPAEVSTQESLAYIIYTSGSTGRPKGVEITHGNLLNLVQWHQEAFDVTSDDRASQAAGLGFDAAGWEIWPHLTAGAAVHIVDEQTRRSPQRLRDWLLSQRITVSFVPTLLAQQMLHLVWPADTALRVLLTGADTLRRRPAGELPFAFINNYGPTECTVVATSGAVAAEEAENEGSPRAPSIGRPILNASVFILDERLRPVGTGEAGELCLGGALVGRGYRNNPELTAERFVQYRTEDGRSVRLYRTGDQARFLPDGKIQFLGRLDEQIKIRGYRVELGEITSNIDRYPGIEASAAAARQTDSGMELIAWIVAAPGARLSDRDLRDHLAQRLAEYMIPARFVVAAALPLTANGKLDAGALPAPTSENVLAGGPDADRAAPNAAPAVASDGVDASDDPLEARIGAIVAELLNQPAVGKDDNFFMIGGHSMLGVQLAARLRDAFAVKLTLRQLFSAPSVRALAGEVARLGGTAGAAAPGSNR